MDPIEEAVRCCIANQTGVKIEKITSSARLLQDLGIDGDDAIELFDIYARRFAVDLKLLLPRWHEYFGPDPASAGLIFLAIFLAGGLVMAGQWIAGIHLEGWTLAAAIAALGLLIIFVGNWYFKEPLKEISVADMVAAVRTGAWPDSCFVIEGEALFRNFADRHSFAIEKMDEPNMDLLMRLPQQKGLALELTLGLQDGDVLNIGFERFWFTFFPFARIRETVEAALEGLASGDCRLAIHRQFGIVIKCVLEKRTDADWQSFYTEYSFFRLPLLKTRISYLYNDAARS